jgi:hypothetical protein
VGPINMFTALFPFNVQNVTVLPAAMSSMILVLLVSWPLLVFGSSSWAISLRFSMTWLQVEIFKQYIVASYFQFFFK